MPEEDVSAASDANDQPKGLLGRMLRRGGKSFKRAKLGLELKMYYNEEVSVLDRVNLVFDLFVLLHLFSSPRFPSTRPHSSLSALICSSSVGFNLGRKTRSARNSRL